MSGHGVHGATLTAVAVFPTDFFLENLAVRSDGSILVTVVNRKELWYVPPTHLGVPAAPQLVASFDQPPSGIIEAEEDVFLVCASNLYTSHDAYLYKLDLRGWGPHRAVSPEMLFRFPDAARALNCNCMLDRQVMLASDGFGSRIWRVDLDAGYTKPAARVWLEHDCMGYFPGSLKPDQPGVNGMRYASRTNKLYFTSTAKQLVMRVAVDPDTFDASGEPEIVAGGRMGDDFCIHEDANVLYLATHRQNSIDRISMDPAENAGAARAVAGSPFDRDLIGPTSGVWGRASGDYGKVAYFTTDGGIASPPKGWGVQPAKLLKVEMPPEAAKPIHQPIPSDSHRATTSPTQEGKS